MAKFCPECGASVGNRSVYCDQCGEKLPEKKQSISPGLGGGDPPPDSLKGLRRR